MAIAKSKVMRVVVVGCGNMGASHALAYEALEGFELCGLVARGNSKVQLNARLQHSVPLYDDMATALRELQPDAVCIASYPDSHEAFALHAIAAGCHVFVEKPLADTVEGAHRVVTAALAARRQLMVGYILRQHPSWQRFIDEARGLGKPLVMRMNLNQQSSGLAWEKHQSILQSLSPMVDCGVHYVDVMCQMAQAPPVRVSAIGARLTDDLPEGMYNYGQLQVVFADGSVGWYEAGWGPMMSETAFFVKDVIGPKGAVSIVTEDAAPGRSSDVTAHTQTQRLRVHHSALDAQGRFLRDDRYIVFDSEPDHDTLCIREQMHFLDLLRRDQPDIDHLNAAVDSLQVALAADTAFRTGQVVVLPAREPFELPGEAL